MEHVRNEQVLIVDCRYPYEYDAGHIKVIINSYAALLRLQTSEALLFNRYRLS